MSADMSEPAQPIAASDGVSEADKPILLMSYLPLLSALAYAKAGQNDYLRWHARQGMALTGCYLGWGIAASLVVAAGEWIVGPRFAAFLTTLGLLGGLGLLALSVYAVLKAFEPCRWRIPLVSSLADKF